MEQDLDKKIDEITEKNTYMSDIDGNVTNRPLGDLLTEDAIVELKEAIKQLVNDSKDTNKLTRVEVIDENGRSYVNWDENNEVKLDYQDDGRTLKIFINKRK